MHRSDGETEREFNNSENMTSRDVVLFESVVTADAIIIILA